MNITDCLEERAITTPDKLAFSDAAREITYGQLKNEADCIASTLLSIGLKRKPVAVFIEKSVECVAAYFGILSSCNFYSPLDIEMPMSRVERIINTLKPSVIIASRSCADKVSEFAADSKMIVYEESIQQKIDDDAVRSARKQIIDKDVMYVLFTSGSTGNPKGVVVSHYALNDFVVWATNKYRFDEKTAFGNQVPFYFSMSIWDIFITVYCGGACHIIPHNLFLFPFDLLTYTANKRITTLVWVPSALTLVVRLKGLSKIHIDSLETVFFGGEVMPVKQLNSWIKEYPSVEFVNIYGPTEVTDTFTAYSVNREFSDIESLPIGEPRTNHEIFVLSDDDRIIKDDEIGELCVRGAGLASGYYNNPEQTKKAFMQNPLNTAYPDTIYRTGDLVRKNKYGELVYVARKDFQIKHMGHRIELGEVETALCSLDGVDSGCCLYDSVKSQIVVFYSGVALDNNVLHQLKQLLPEYMIPTRRHRLDVMPMNLNGKIDRARLNEMISEGVK